MVFKRETFKRECEPLRPDTTETERKIPKKEKISLEEFLQHVDAETLQKPVSEENLKVFEAVMSVISVPMPAIPVTLAEALFICFELLDSTVAKTEAIECLIELLKVIGLSLEPLDSCHHMIRWLGESKRTIFIKPSGKLSSEIRSGNSVQSNSAVFLEFYGKCRNNDDSFRLPLKQKTPKTLLRDIGAKSNFEWHHVFDVIRGLQKKPRRPAEKRSSEESRQTPPKQLRTDDAASTDGGISPVKSGAEDSDSDSDEEATD
ncbi:hypothetical protein HDE_12480 [Halotydeus destructor]|nr:hypothetical protein HDE_12480 [Halotydeus destructor]